MKIWIDGFFASGKSTLLKKICKTFSLSEINEVKQDNLFLSIKEKTEKNKNHELLFYFYLMYDKYLKSIEFEDHYVIERSIIGHWVMGRENIIDKKINLIDILNDFLKIYMKNIDMPDHCFILDVNWKNFRKRRKINEKEEVFYKSLIQVYNKELISICKSYSIPYTVIDTNNLNQDEVFENVSKIIKKIK